MIIFQSPSRIAHSSVGSSRNGISIPKDQRFWRFKVLSFRTELRLTVVGRYDLSEVHHVSSVGNQSRPYRRVRYHPCGMCLPYSDDCRYANAATG
ncbi:hypothetical protein KCP76_13640 [Salmonella enterica subsp. enterica serovar Weltevreden]|nr:hypothetical protein KCP76_13640 [Salmonella enterica subsp. enterica serovar Weltevreden]